LQLPDLSPSTINQLTAVSSRSSEQTLLYASDEPSPVILQPDPFSLFVSLIPLDGETIEVRVKATESLEAAPLAKIWQNGSTSAINATLDYDPDLDAYTGQATINPALGRQGTVEVQGTDSEGQTVMALVRFSIEEVIADAITPYLRSADGFFELMLPAGAFDSDTYLAIQTAQPGPTQIDGLKQVGAAYQVFVASGQTSLNLPTVVNLYFPVDPAAKVDLATLQLYYWRPLEDRWLLAGNSIVGLSHNLVSTKVERLGMFALFGEQVDAMKTYLPMIHQR
jgi:hypothetical protein